MIKENPTGVNAKVRNSSSDGKISTARPQRVVNLHIKEATSEMDYLFKTVNKITCFNLLLITIAGALVSISKTF